jgi:hypothetical protein
VRRHLIALTAALTAVVTLAACDPATTASLYHEPIEAVTPDQQFTLWVLGMKLAARNDPTLVCIRAHESANLANPWAAYNPDGPYYGAYQYVQSTWDNAAQLAGRPDLAGRTPMEPYVDGFDQDTVTLAAHRAWGDGPWGNRC